MAKAMPRAGRAPRTPGAVRPPLTPGKTSGSIRSRTDADQPFNPTGRATPWPQPEPQGGPGS